jgi:hypothetical protein
MIFDEKYSIPRCAGSTDFLDSPVIAGLMLLTEHPEAQKIKPQNYYQEGKYWRYPFDTTLDMSRDNGIPLMAALWKSGYTYLVDLNYIVGRDWMSPSIKGHEARCQGEYSTWFQNLWLWLDVLWNIYITPNRESNQLWCQMLVAPKKYMRFYCKHHKDFRKPIRDYWCNWRMESELAEHMIRYIEARL